MRGNVDERETKKRGNYKEKIKKFCIPKKKKQRKIVDGAERKKKE